MGKQVELNIQVKKINDEITRLRLISKGIEDMSNSQSENTMKHVTQKKVKVQTSLWKISSV
jgi:hypothetical protein